MWFINKVEGQLCQATADHAGRLTHAPTACGSLIRLRVNYVGLQLIMQADAMPTACGSLIRLRVNYARLQLIMQADSPMHPQHVVH